MGGCSGSQEGRGSQEQIEQRGMYQNVKNRLPEHQIKQITALGSGYTRQDIL